jgi:hypothetical protein
MELTVSACRAKLDHRLRRRTSLLVDRPVGSIERGGPDRRAAVRSPAGPAAAWQR